MAESEELQVRLLHFLSIVSHLMVFVESSTRFDISLADMLSTVNRIRWVLPVFFAGYVSIIVYIFFFLANSF